MSAQPDLQPTGLRERKKMERRRAIEAAALDLFETQGFDATTTEQIAAAADIAPRTFFGYFPTKEDVVLADYAQRLERIVEELAARPSSEGPWNALENSLLVVATDYEAEREQLVRRFRIVAETPSVFARNLALQAGWEDTLAMALSGRIDDSHAGRAMVSRLMAASALAAMRSSIRHWLATGHEQPLPELLSGSFEHLRRGFGDIAVTERVPGCR